MEACNELKWWTAEVRRNSKSVDLIPHNFRRASLAVALLHEPELLILDEPTVGVDPLLRQIIWSHLIKISRTTTTTIVITTHYVEEARQAHRVKF